MSLEPYLNDDQTLEVGIDEAGRGCEEKDALILTKNGWKKYDELDLENDRVYSYTKDHKTIWQKIDKIVTYEVDEELIEMKHSSIHIVVTKDHYFDVLTRIMKRNEKGSSMVVGYRVQRKLVTDLKDNDYLPRIGEWSGLGLKYFILPGIKYKNSSIVKPPLKINMNDWLAFLGLYLAEGCTTSPDKGSYIIHIAQTKEHNLEDINLMLKKLPFKFNRVKNSGFVCHNKQLYTYLKPIGNCYTKYIPTKFKNLSQKQSNILLNWMIFGDGNIFQHIGNRKPEIRYYTSSLKLKDDFEELALKCGYGFNTIVKSEAGTTAMIEGRIIKRTTDNYQITLRRSPMTVFKHLLKHKKNINKKTTVFCLALPEHHNFFVKRSGSGYFTGNCLLSRVYAGAVFWDPSVTSELVRDSKKLDHRKRLVAYDFIKEHCLSYGYGYAEAKEIDRINILQATLNAMHRAVDACYVTPQHILVDGTQFKTYTDDEDQAINYTLVTGGDDKYYSIAAASIVAKVEHDLYITKLCDQHSELDLYDIRNNKGYGSRKHTEAIANWGITPFHRKSFGICKKYAN